MAASEVTTAAMEAHDQGHVAGSDTTATLVVVLGSAYQDASPERLLPVLKVLDQAFSGPASPVRGGLVAYPSSHGDTVSTNHGAFQLQPFLQAVPAHSLAVQPAAAWLNAYELIRAHGSTCALLLGADAESLSSAAMAEMVQAVQQGNAGISVPRYALHPHQGLLNAGMLSPLSRAIYGVDVKFPLALDYAFSTRMAERMAGLAQRFTSSQQGDAILWPVAEAAVGGFDIAEVTTGERDLPQPQEDLSALLNLVAGSMFSDIEARAAFWQRNRPVKEVERFGGGPSVVGSGAEPPGAEEIDDLIKSFRIGYSNLHEIWSLVLPPNTLLGLKRLSQASRENFTMPDALWVRVVYDFVLAHRLRTLSRGHLLGALTPLYLAWVASHILANDSARTDEQLARAFEADKPYLVSRWRWPDRFNP